MRTAAARLVLVLALALASLGVSAVDPYEVDATATTAITEVTYPATGESVTVTWDGFGVPHVYAANSEAAAYAVGYLQGHDKLWIAHLLRIIGKGQLSDLLGPIPDSAASDRNYRLFGYTDSERIAKLERLPDDVQREIGAHAAGLNQAITEVNTDPTKVPAEFVAFGLLPVAPWTLVDSVAAWDVLVESSATGGRGDLGQAALLNRLRQAHGDAVGRAMFDDLIRADDPDAAVSVPAGVDWRALPTRAHPDVEAGRSLVGDARLSLADEQPLPVEVAPVAVVPDEAAASVAAAAQQERRLEEAQPPFIRDLWGSNAQAIAPALSAGANTLLTAGPQTNYNVPSVYWEVGIHTADGTDVTGISAPGIPYVAIGRGSGYAWTVTNGYSDVNDTFVEVLHPTDDRRYLFEDRWEPMDCRTEILTSRGVPYETYEVCRTHHGPVMELDLDRRVAYSRAVSHFDRELQTLLSFRGFGRADSIEDFATAAVRLSGNWNIFYVDERGELGYWHVGNHPRRSATTDIRLAHDGTGGAEWQGLLPAEELPHAPNLSRGWITNWNNSPAVGWPTNRSTGPVHRNDRVTRAFTDHETPDPHGGVVEGDGLWSADDVIANLRYAAHASIDEALLTTLPDAASLTSDVAREALAIVSGWDGLAYDADGDGRHDSPAVPIMDEFLDVALDLVFLDDLGGDAGRARPSELWHALSPDRSAPLRFDWLNGRPAEELRAEAFETAVARLRASKGDDPASWSTGEGVQRYEHVNYHIFLDLVDNAECPEPVGGLCLRDYRTELGLDELLPGYVAPHRRMNRGVWNHVVAYLDKPDGGREFGAARTVACSVLTPGNSGFMNVALETGPHYQDQVDLYVDWEFKRFALTDDEVTLAVAPDPCPTAAQLATTLTYVGETSARGQTVVLAARLIDDVGAPLPGRALRFELDGNAVDAVTGPDGVAEVSVDVPDHGREQVVTVAFDGDDVHTGSSTTARLVWGRDPHP
ncbi:MAG TPA: penicillin acylase family protein [Nitriliruptorales bacterium]